jgi:hypothetical protein
MAHPIGFSIPEEKIVTSIPNKTKIMSTLIPGIQSSYIYNTEEEYYNEYKTSYFAITKQKAGWDCMRHYEILANGCVPYFVNIEICPENTLTFLPKDLLLEGNYLYEKFENKTVEEITEEEKNEYNILVTKLLEHTRNFLTTSKMAKYVLEKTYFQYVSKILVLSGDPSPDYLRCLTLHGFKELFGANCHDYPKIKHIYKSPDIQYEYLYGKGISYCNLLDQSLHNNNLDDTIEENIKNKYYDIVIYGSYHRGMPYYDLVNSVYKPNEIILLCGEDHNVVWCNHPHWLPRGHPIFVREQ